MKDRGQLTCATAPSVQRLTHARTDALSESPALKLIIVHVIEPYFLESAVVKRPPGCRERQELVGCRAIKANEC